MQRIVAVPRIRIVATQFAFLSSHYFDEFEQLVSVLVAEGRGVLEIDKADDTHTGATGGVVVAEQVYQREEEVIEIVVREVRLRRESWR